MLNPKSNKIAPSSSRIAMAQKYAAEPVVDIDDLEDDEGDQGESLSARMLSKKDPKTRATEGLSTGFTVSQGAVAAVGQLTHLSAHVAGMTSVGAALSPVVAITGPVGLALSMVESGFSAYSAVKTYTHIKRLEQIIEMKGAQALDGTVEAIVYCCKKKNNKLKHKGLGVIPVLGSICNTVYAIGRSAQKRINGTRGVERRVQAATLWTNAMSQDTCAIAACRELLGSAVYEMIKDCVDGDLVLKKKMRSM